MYEFTIYDTRTGQEIGKSIQPDSSTESENSAIRAVDKNPTDPFVATEVRELSDDAARRYVGD